MTATTAVAYTGPISDPREPDVGLDAARSKLDDLRRAAVDAISDTRRLTLVPTGFDNPPSVYDRVRIDVIRPGGDVLPIRVLQGAHEQIADRTGIPWKYYERMLGEAPDLLSQNVNTWHDREPGKRLVRMLKPLTPNDHEVMTGLGTQLAARAVLSDRYRVLDHGSLLSNVIPVAETYGLRVAEWSLTEKKFYVRFAAPDEALEEMIPQIFGGLVLKPGFDIERIRREAIAFGASLSNSETGHGAVNLDPYFHVRHCLNAIIVDYYGEGGKQIRENLRTIHIGGKQTEGDIYAADTRALDNAAVFLKVRDRMGSFFSGETKQRAARVLLNGMATKIELPEEIGQFTFIENVAGTFDLSETEQNILREEVLNELQVTRNPLTPWAISQGLTAMARRIGTGDMERKQEIERLGWRVLDDPVEKLVKAATAKARNN